MPKIVIRDKQTGQEFEGATGTPFDQAKYEMVGSEGYGQAEERPPGPGVPAGEAAIKPSFLQALGGAAKERAGEVGQFPKDLMGFGGDVVRTGSSMVPGPIGGLAAAGGSLVGDVMQGQSPDLTRAGIAGGTTAALGGLGKLLGPLSKLRIAGTGKGKDAQLVADAIGAAKPSMQTAGTPQALQNMMRGQQGKDILSGEMESAMGGIRGKLPSAPPTTVTGQQGLPVQVFPDQPPLSREGFDTTTTQIRKLGKLGKNAAGVTRDSASADTSLMDREDLIANLRKALGETSPALKQSYDAARGEYAGGSALKRLFKESGDLSPERVLSSKGMNMRELQDRATKHQPRLEAGLGQDKAAEFLKSIFRGGAPPMGDKRLAIPLTKLGGFNIPLGMDYLAGQGIDPRLLQMLLQGGGAGVRQGLGQ